jgi:hypothetical protein
VGQAAAATQFQQLQAEQDNQALQDQLKAAQANAERLKAELLAAPQREYETRLAAYNAAVAEANRLKGLVDTKAAAATLAAQNSAQAEALAAGLATANEQAQVLAESLKSITNKDDAVLAVNAVLGSATQEFEAAKGNLASAAQGTANAQRSEAEATAQAKVAAEAAQAASQLKTALDAATTKAQQDAAAQAARVAAAAAKTAADAAATAAASAATSAQNTANSTFDKLTGNNINLATDYKLSNPAATDPTPSSVRSVRSIFTQAELATNPTLKTFVDQWDAFIKKQQEKFAALAEQAAKDAALLLAEQTETAIKNAASIAAAKAVAQAALIAANTKKETEETERKTAEDNAKNLALEEAKRLGEREAAEIAKAAAAQLAAEIAAKDLAAIQDAAKAAAAALLASQEAEAAKALQAIKDAETAAGEAQKAKDDVAVLPVLTPPTPPAATPI